MSTPSDETTPPALTVDAVWSAVFHVARCLGDAVYAEAMVKMVRDSGAALGSEPYNEAMQHVEEAQAKWLAAHDDAKAKVFARAGGFTQEDVRWLRGIADDPFLPHAGIAGRLADRIAALLPPEKDSLIYPLT